MHGYPPSFDAVFIVLPGLTLRPIPYNLKIREPLKIAFVTRTCEIFSGKAEGQNRRRHSQSYVEDEVWPDNAAGGDFCCSQ